MEDFQNEEINYFNGKDRFGNKDDWTILLNNLIQSNLFDYHLITRMIDYGLRFYSLLSSNSFEQQRKKTDSNR